MSQFTPSYLVAKLSDTLIVNVDMEDYLSPLTRKRVPYDKHEGVFSRYLMQIEEETHIDGGHHNALGVYIDELCEMLGIEESLQPFFSSDSSAIEDIDSAIQDGRLESVISDPVTLKKIQFLIDQEEEIAGIFYRTQEGIERGQYFNQYVKEFESLNEGISSHFEVPWDFISGTNQQVTNLYDIEYVQLHLSENDLHFAFTSSDAGDDVEVGLNHCFKILNEYSHSFEASEDAHHLLTGLAAFKADVEYHQPSGGDSSNNRLTNDMGELTDTINEQLRDSYSIDTEHDVDGCDYLDIVGGSEYSLDGLREILCLIEEDLPESTNAMKQYIEKVEKRHEHNVERLTNSQIMYLKNVEEVEGSFRTDFFRSIRTSLSMTPLKAVDLLITMPDSWFNAFIEDTRVTNSPRTFSEKAAGFFAIADFDLDQSKLSDRSVRFIEALQCNLDADRLEEWGLKFVAILAQKNALDVLGAYIQSGHYDVKTLQAFALSYSGSRRDGDYQQKYIDITLESLYELNRRSIAQGDLFMPPELNALHKDHLSEEGFDVLHFHVLTNGLFRNGESDPVWRILESLPEVTLSQYIESMDYESLCELVVLGEYQADHEGQEEGCPLFNEFLLPAVAKSTRADDLWLIRGELQSHYIDDQSDVNITSVIEDDRYEMSDEKATRLINLIESTLNDTLNATILASASSNEPVENTQSFII